MSDKHLIFEQYLLVRENQSENDSSLIKQIYADLNINTFFTATYGTGVAALIRPVNELLSNSNASLNKTEVILLIIASLAYVTRQPDYKKLVALVKEKQLFQYLKRCVTFIKVVRRLVKNAAGVGVDLSNVLGYTVLMVPVVNTITSYIAKSGIGLDNITDLLKGVVGAALVFALKNILSRVNFPPSRTPI